jgi:uncharacterized protein (DUF1778 family)
MANRIPDDVKRTKAVFLRFSVREHRRVAEAAERHGMRLTDFCRSAVRVAADALPVQRRPEP